MKRMKMILIVVLVAILTLGYLKSENNTSQPSTEAGITPAGNSPSDSSGNSFGASAGTILLTSDDGTTYNVPITAMDTYEKPIPLSTVDIKNLRYDSAKQEITGEAKSGLSKGLHTVMIAAAAINYRSGGFNYSNFAQVSVLEKSAPYSTPFALRGVEKEALLKVKITIVVPKSNFISQ